MRILLIGSSGTLGKEVAKCLREYHCDLIEANRSSGDYTVDISLPESIESLFQEVGAVDAIICTAGEVRVTPIAEMTLEDNMIAVQSKLLGQINLVLIGQKFLNSHGSITLTTGVTKDDPIVGGASGAMANGAIAAFVKSAAVDMQGKARINCVSPTIVDESFVKYQESYAGFISIPASRAAQGYIKSVFGGQTGQEYQYY
ncbi:short chain dehydrogenase [Lactovum odontotermitis]